MGSRTREWKTDETTKGKPGSVCGHGIEARPKNWLAPASLVTLGEGSFNGYELMERLAASGLRETNPGTLADKTGMECEELSVLGRPDPVIVAAARKLGGDPPSSSWAPKACPVWSAP